MTIDLGITTAGREVADKTRGCAVQVGAAILFLVAVGLFALFKNQDVEGGWWAIPVVLVIVSYILLILGGDLRNKAAHVAWTREAIERSAQTSTPEPTIPRRERECPHCAELILRNARLCKHCHNEVDPLGG